MHQLGEDGRFLSESLEDNVQHGCEEDVEQQRGHVNPGIPPQVPQKGDYRHLDNFLRFSST